MWDVIQPTIRRVDEEAQASSTRHFFVFGSNLDVIAAGLHSPQVLIWS